MYIKKCVNTAIMLVDRKFKTESLLNYCFVHCIILRILGIILLLKINNGISF